LLFLFMIRMKKNCCRISAMPERMVRLVTNTTPLISITAAMGDLDALRFVGQEALQSQVFV